MNVNDMNKADQILFDQWIVSQHAADSFQQWKSIRMKTYATPFDDDGKISVVHINWKRMTTDRDYYLHKNMQLSGKLYPCL